ncbi:hypothetical protein ACRQ84_06225 [Enterobacter ludwigii]
MTTTKQIVIKYSLHGEEKVDAFDSDGYDKINGVLEFLADKYVPAQLVEAQPRGSERNQIGKRNLIEHGVSNVSYFDDEDSVWVEFQDLDLRNV